MPIRKAFKPKRNTSLPSLVKQTTMSITMRWLWENMDREINLIFVEWFLRKVVLLIQLNSQLARVKLHFFLLGFSIEDL